MEISKQLKRGNLCSIRVHTMQEGDVVWQFETSDILKFIYKEKEIRIYDLIKFCTGETLDSIEFKEADKSGTESTVDIYSNKFNNLAEQLGRVLDEIGSVEFYSEFHKKLSTEVADKVSDENVITRISIPCLTLVNLFLKFKDIYTHEEFMEKVYRVLGMHLRYILPNVFSENIKIGKPMLDGYLNIYINSIENLIEIIKTFRISELNAIQLLSFLPYIFVLPDIHPKLMLVTIECIVQLFFSHLYISDKFMEGSLASIFGILDNITTTNKSIKKSKVMVDSQILVHGYTFLILRLIHGVSCPNDIWNGKFGLSALDMAKKHYELVKKICSQFAGYYINKLVITKSKQRDGYNNHNGDIASMLLVDLVKSSTSPKFCLSKLLIQIIIIQLIKISNSALTSNTLVGSLAQLVDTSSRELSITLIGLSLPIVQSVCNISKNIVLGAKVDNISLENEKVKVNSEDIGCYCLNNEGISQAAMLDCDKCHRWFHMKCVSVEPSNVPEIWNCDDCILEQVKVEVCHGIKSEELKLDIGDILNISAISIFHYLTITNFNMIGMTRDIIENSTIFDLNSSIRSSFILEILMRLNAQSNDENKKKEIFRHKKLGKHDKNIIKKHGNNKISLKSGSSVLEYQDLHSLFLNEWLSPITSNITSLTAYSSKLPKIMQSTINRLWCKIISSTFTVLVELMLNCILVNIHNSPSMSQRRTAVNALGNLLVTHPILAFTNDSISNALLNALQDKAPKVRERSLVLIEKLILDNNCDLNLEINSKESSSMKIPQYMYESICRMSYDISPLVRIAAVRILRQLYEKRNFDLSIGALLLRRLTSPEETQTIRRYVMDVFTSLWFSKSKVCNKISCTNFVNILKISQGRNFQQLQGSSNWLLHQLIGAMRTSMSSSEIEESVTRWVPLLLDMFLEGFEHANNETEVSEANESGLITESNDLLFSNFQINCLKALETLGEIFPHSTTVVFPHIIIYMRDINSGSSDALIHICNILSYIIPLDINYDISSLVIDFINIINNARSPQLIKSAICCLCKIIQKPDIDKTHFHLLIIDKINTIWDYNNKQDLNLFDKKTIDIIRRNCWIIGCIYEFSSPELPLSLKNGRIIETNYCKTEFGISFVTSNSNQQLMNFKESDKESDENIESDYSDCIESSNLVFDLICSLYYKIDWKLGKSVILPTITEFLVKQKQFIKTIKFSKLIQCAIRICDCTDNPTSSNSDLCIACLQCIFSLLNAYETEALKPVEDEDIISDNYNASYSCSEDKLNTIFSETANDNEESDIFHTPVRKKSAKVSEFETDSNSPISSRTSFDYFSSLKASKYGSSQYFNRLASVSAAQPLAAHLDLLLDLIRLLNECSNEKFTQHQKQMVAILVICILEQFNRQGLVNPTSIIAPVSGMLFSLNKDLSVRAYQITSNLFDKFPNLVINKFKDITVYGFNFIMGNFPTFLGNFESNGETRRIFDNDLQNNECCGISIPIFCSNIMELYNRLYVEKCRNKKSLRETIIKGLCKQLELLINSESIDNLLNKLFSKHKIDNYGVILLYVEFVSYLIMSTPFVYESEVLLLIYTMGEMCILCSQFLEDYNEKMNEYCQSKSFTLYTCTLLVTICTCMQKVLKTEYKINDQNLSCFNPNTCIVKEKPKYAHLDIDTGESSSINIAGVTLTRSTVYNSLNCFRKKGSSIYTFRDEPARLRSFMNETLYSQTEVISEKEIKLYRRKNRKRPSNKKGIDSDDSSQSWSPTKISKNR
ncbi:HEAT repeat family protein [Cryptosporidium muris RN66]|uniref:Sister chromatid cohesion protein n=1 Tax=Cryptosporidium muris (strain RN66) TaxID=441375 RepID=B6A9L3_CRYMR|nr:HEAT repeat family protein [Cryptosporidium muris RN66]EEA04904.1 HEAT repeat family protein [Cryptosporidium muris RN66]|eukprot:XP_002139253.1 HEAT repeat family protein [Cryptosporidium muris RN66]